MAVYLRNDFHNNTYYYQSTVGVLMFIILFPVFITIRVGTFQFKTFVSIVCRRLRVIQYYRTIYRTFGTSVR